MEKINHDENGCWVWMAGKLWAGYGQYWNGTTMVRAHRYAFEMIKGAVPNGLELDHLCRVRACVNPDHMEAVTHAENQRRRRGLPTAHRRKEGSS